MTTNPNDYIPADPKSPYWDPNHADHAAEVQRVAQLFESAYPNEPGEAGAPEGDTVADMVRRQLGAFGEAAGKRGPATYEQYRAMLRKQAGAATGESSEVVEQQPQFKLDAPAVRAGVLMDQDAVTTFGELAKSESLERPAAQELLNTYGELAEKAPAGGWTEQDAHQALDRLWGSNKQDHLTRVQKYVATKPALAAWLDSTGAGNDPAVLSILHVLARGGDGSVGEYRAAIDKAYFDANDQRHREAVQAVRIMYAAGLR